MDESFVGCLAAEAAVGAVVVVVVLPLLQFLGEQVGVVDDLALEEPVELFGIDAGGPPGAQRRLLTRVVPVRQSGRVPSLHWVNRSPQRGQLDGR